MLSETRASIEKSDAKVKATTIAQQGKEVSLIIKLLNAYVAGFNKLGEFTLSENNELEYAWLLLTTRSFNSLQCAFDLLQKGYYSQALMYIRSVFEDWYTAKDCETNPKTLNALLQGDDYFRKQEGHFVEIAKRVEKRIEIPGAWKTIYGSLSTIAHARKQALMILITPKIKELRLGGHYDKDLFLASYQSFLAAASIVPELLYKLLGDYATQWWIEIQPTLQVAIAEIERIGEEFKANNFE
jgi:hypothetical protein